MSSGFVIPGSDAPHLPAEIEQKIEESVQRFAAKFDSFGMIGRAVLTQHPGWLEEYRKELVTLAVAVRESTQ